MYNLIIMAFIIQDVMFHSTLVEPRHRIKREFAEFGTASGTLTV